ncbi:MAG: GlxA family transcriptional regulator [Aestuariivirga sp.]
MASSQHIGLLLLPGFPLMSYAAVVEPMRAANLLSGSELFRWTNVAATPTVISSSGVMAQCERIARVLPRFDLLFVVTGGNPARFDHPPTFAWLRRMAKMGTRLGGVSGGPFILAKAGLMDGHSMTVHWEHATVLREEFPLVHLRRSLFVIDRQRITCAGGTAPLDMMHALIAETHGTSLAQSVSDWFLHTDVRPSHGAQRASIVERYRIHDAKLIAALEMMESNIGDPLTRAEAAKRLNVSTRQLDRLFAAHLGLSFQNQYMEIRLANARAMLRQTGISITGVALANGFSSGSHFSRAYKGKFRKSPSEERLH